LGLAGIVLLMLIALNILRVRRLTLLCHFD
jgi:hypothetical protein